MSDAKMETGLARFPALVRYQSLDGIPYRICESPQQIRKTLRHEFCLCHEKNMLATPFAKYSCENMEAALALARTLGVTKSIKLLFPVKPHYLVILFPPDFICGVFVKAIDGGGQE